MVTEAALRGTPTVGFDVPGLRTRSSTTKTGLLARTEAEFASAWAALALDPARRAAHGRGRAAPRLSAAMVDRGAALLRGHRRGHRLAATPSPAHL